jgi:predicted AlkP superfamily phosphohydrolase/phosphomutase
MDEKVIIVELDGATWDIIDPMISRGELPNFKILKEQGTYGVVDSTYWGSPEIWTSIFTGKTQEKCGTPFFGIDRARLKAKRLWEIAAERDLRIGVLHSLLSWPPAEVDGFIIPDVFAMGSETYPRKYEYFQKLYLSRRGKNVLKQGYYFLRSFLLCGSPGVLVALLKFFMSALFHPQFLDTFHRRLMVVTKMDHHLFPKLCRRYQPHLATYHLHALDTTSHKYWQYMGKNGKYGQVICDFYREADRFIGTMIRSMDEHTNLVVLADHGFQEYAEGRGKFDLNVSLLRKLLGLGSADRVVRFGDSYVINMGPSASRDDTARITEELAEARLQDGNSLFVNVKKVGSNIHFWTPNRVLMSKTLEGEAVTFRSSDQVAFSELFKKKSFEDTGIHLAGKGVFAVLGKNFGRGRHIEKVRIFDLTPTLLTILGLPIGRDMDGDWDPRWFTLQALESIRPSYISSYETEEEKDQERPAEVYTEQEVEDLEERLKMLGYL